MELYRYPDKQDTVIKIYFHISQPKHMCWVLNSSFYALTDE